jgi:hypothetical protein
VPCDYLCHFVIIMYDCVTFKILICTLLAYSGINWVISRAADKMENGAVVSQGEWMEKVCKTE